MYLLPDGIYGRKAGTLEKNELFLSIKDKSLRLYINIQHTRCIWQKIVVCIAFSLMALSLHIYTFIFTALVHKGVLY